MKNRMAWLSSQFRTMEGQTGWQRTERNSILESSCAVVSGDGNLSGGWPQPGLRRPRFPDCLRNRQLPKRRKRGGKVVVGAYANPKDSFEPVRFLSLSAISAGMTAYDTLVGRDAQLHPTPWLAKSWDFNSDATEWVFKLREDVVFHDGKKFGADDVIYTYSRMIGPESTSPLKVVFEHVAEIKKDDDHTVRFVLNSPDVDFPVSCGDHRSVVLRDGYTDFRKTTIGTGPFKVKSYEPGVRYNFVRNDDYWGDDGPWVDEIEFLGIQDATTRFNALLSGDIDVVGGLDPKGQDLIERRDDLEIITAKSTTPVSLTMMLDREPTNDPNLRLALKYAVDRERIVDVVFKGLAHIGNDHTISPILPFHCADIPQRPYDPEKARFYIKKAGLENVPIDIHTSDVIPGMVAATEVFQETASAAGIKVNVIRVPADTFWDTAWMVKPLYVAYWDAPFIGPRSTSCSPLCSQVMRLGTSQLGGMSVSTSSSWRPAAPFMKASVMTFQQYSLVSSICIRTRRPARSCSRCWRSTFCRAPIATWDVRGWSCGGSW